jgi:hypothetical protein
MWIDLLTRALSVVRMKVKTNGETDDAQPLGVYRGGKEGEALVTVEWLQREDPEEGDKGAYVSVKAEAWAEITEAEPDYWQVEWYHFAGLIRGEFKDYLDEALPNPDTREKVWNAALEVPLPKELRGLFTPIPS